MSYDDRASRYGDSRIDDYWYHRYRQIDAEYAAADRVRQSDLDRWEVNVGRNVEPEPRDRGSRLRPGDYTRPSRSQRIREIGRYYERVQTSIRACTWLDGSVRESWLTRLRAINLLDDAACDELNTLHDDLESYGEGFIRSLGTPWGTRARDDVSFTLLNVTSDLTLLASACLQLSWIR
jgi:hypothetical protein